eukprot:SAG22_NODE_1203_length_5178_cov_1.734200_8_plen_147_part_01
MQPALLPMDPNTQQQQAAPAEGKAAAAAAAAAASSAATATGQVAPLLLTDGFLLYRILEHAEWRIRGLFPLLSKQCHALSGLPAHWDFLARCASREFGLYVSPVEGFVHRQMFLELWQARTTFSAEPDGAAAAAAATARAAGRAVGR